jgi:L-asparaginase / beta-aspartyl-peptidase
VSGGLVAIHAGAGPRTEELADCQAECREALAGALTDAATILEGGGDAVSAAQAAVMVLEAFPLFNAGVGSALCADGTVQMSAALMRGADRQAGAVAGVTRTRFPILAARAVFESPQVLMLGAAADARAASEGAEQWPPARFITERQRARLEPRAAGAGTDRGTVGAVCLDSDGTLAAATSTGGVFGQPPGRVGDSPVFGAGTWADDHVAVSCTGDGELFVRAGVARTIAVRVAGASALGQAAEGALADVSALGGHGGLIAIDASGALALPFSTETMPRGVWRTGSGPQVWV